MSHVVKPDARSPYQRYGKSPFKYSALFNAWRSAVTTPGKERDARRLSEEHKAAMHREKPLMQPIGDRRPNDLAEAA